MHIIDNVMTTFLPKGEAHGLRHGCGPVDTTWLTPNFASNPFGVDGWFLPYINPPNLFIHYPNNKQHQANMDIYP